MRLQDKIRDYATPCYTQSEAERQRAAYAKLDHMKAERTRRAIGVSLTRSNKKTIQEAIKELPEDEQMNVYAVTNKVAELLIDRYGTDEGNGTTNYQLERTKMRTTQEIMDKVQYYFKKYSRRAILDSIAHEESESSLDEETEIA